MIGIAGSVALVLCIVLCALRFEKAQASFDQGNSDDGLAHLLIGVSGLFASVIVGVPLVLGQFYTP